MNIIKQMMPTTKKEGLVIVAFYKEGWDIWVEEIEGWGLVEEEEDFTRYANYKIFPLVENTEYDDGTLTYYENSDNTKVVCKIDIKDGIPSDEELEEKYKERVEGMEREYREKIKDKELKK